MAKNNESSIPKLGAKFSWKNEGDLIIKLPKEPKDKEKNVKK